MTTTVATPVAAPPKVSFTRRRWVKGGRNYLGGLFGWVWLAIIIIIIPVYYVVITTFKDQGAYFTQNPLGLPNPPTLTAHQQVVEAGIIRYFFNSVIVTVGAVIPLVMFIFLASTPSSGAMAGCCASALPCSCSASPSRCGQQSSQCT
jgi:raffinose/stachyose/melibiose transport system permease protein